MLVERHQRKLRNLLRQLSGSSAQADDLAQEVFLVAWCRIGSFRGEGSFSGWLMRIAYNAFLQSARRRSREREVFARLSLESTLEMQGDASASIDATRCLSVLADAERIVMLLCYAHGFSHAEISKIVDMPVGTVKSHIRRGRLKILDRFETGREND